MLPIRQKMFFLCRLVWLGGPRKESNLDCLYRGNEASPRCRLKPGKKNQKLRFLKLPRPHTLLLGVLESTWPSVHNLSGLGP